MRILILCLFIANSLFADRIEDLILEHQNKYQVPGIAVVLVEKGSAPQYKFYGYADPERKIPIRPDTIFSIASITKVFVSTLLALEIEKGKMKLTDPAARYIPGLSNNLIKGFKNVRLVDLATHTSALPRTPPPKKGPYSREEVIGYLAGWNPEYPIASKYVYSNLGFGLLAYAIAGVNRTPFEVLLKREILQPLNMMNTDLRIPSFKERQWAQGFNKKGDKVIPEPVTSLPGGGAMKSTPRDMAQFLLANMNVIGPEPLRKAMKFAQQPQYKVSEKLSLGLGWQIVKNNDFTLIDKNGGHPGFASYIGFDDQNRVGVVVLMTKGKSQSTTIGRAILLQKLSEIKAAEPPK